MRDTDTHIAVTVYGHDNDGNLWGYTKEATVTRHVYTREPKFLAVARKQMQAQAERELQDKGITTERVIWKERRSNAE